jgi:hypothetical protein
MPASRILGTPSVATVRILSATRTPAVTPWEATPYAGVTFARLAEIAHDLEVTVHSDVRLSEAEKPHRRALCSCGAGKSTTAFPTEFNRSLADAAR